MTDEQEIDCPACGGEGGYESAPGKWSTDGIGDWARCFACYGTGQIVVPLEIRTLDDLEREDENGAC